MKRVLPCLLLICFARQAEAGAWTQAENAWYLSVSEYYFSSDAYRDRDGKRQAQESFFKSELNAYAEYGYSDDLTLGANLFFNYVEQAQTLTINTVSITYDAHNYGMGDSELFARYRLYQDNDYVLSVQPLVKLPAINAYDSLPKGGGEQPDYELSLLGGMSFEWLGQHHYLDTRLGYRYRHDDMLHAQYKADVKLGLRVNKTLTLIPAIYAIWAETLPENVPYSQSGQNDYDLIKLETTLQYDLPDSPVSLHTGIFTHAGGRNSGTGTAAFVGAAWKL